MSAQHVASAPAPRARAAADTAAAQLRRLLDVIPRLADGADHAFADVAAREGVSAAQLVHDMRLLWARVGDPGGFVEGVQVMIEADRVSLRSDHFRRPMRLTRAELAALDLGLAMLRAERPAAGHAAVDGARALLRKAIAGSPADDGGRWATAPAADAAVLTCVRDALRARRPVRIAYRKAGATAGDVERREVRPYALAAVRAAWYLVGHAVERDAVRVFRVDRIVGAESGEGRYAVPASFSLDALLADGRAFVEPPAAEALVVRYSARVAPWIAERERGSVEADGSFVVEHRMADAEWAVRHVLQYGADAEVLGPARVRDAVAARLAAMVADGA